MLQVNQATINLIKSFEGLYLKAYHDSIDPPGVDTIGYGTIKYPPTYLGGKAVKVGDPDITQQQALEFLTYEVNQKAQAVQQLIKKPLNANQFGALVSFAYNLGEGALGRSTLLKKVNAKPDDPTITNEFMKWVYASGKQVPGLVRRRTAEARLYFTPITK